jgi:gliding motility-associated-like protein
LPAPKALPVNGSKSVCPFVEEVDYWTIDDQNSLHWLVNGGVIVSNAANDSIKINWWDTNPIASASIFSTNSYQCNSDTTVFPVRINVALITEKPKGPDKLCIADSKNIIYNIQNTNGSVYTWMADEGEIISGQGTNEVVVDWKKAGLHQIYVQETSVTTDTICFGESEPLAVEIVNDSLEIYLNQVSFNSNNNIVVKYSSLKLQNLIHSLFFLVENKNGSGFQEQIIPILENGEYIYLPNTSDLSPDKMNLKVINSCDEVFYSNQQQTIVLHGTEILSQDIIRLNWNTNQFWENDRMNSEIWHSENGNNGWELISDDETGIEYNFPFQGLSLTQYFKVKVINQDKNSESWSNTINILIDDKLIIPDVFTPNGDGFNDDWKIENINFHTVKSIAVYNKLGEVVFESGNEYVPWDGTINGEIIQGTYFYQITFNSEDTRYGQVTILR